MHTQTEVTKYLKPQLKEIIEVIVTQNMGFEPDRERPFKAGQSTFNYIDCRGLSYEEAIEVDPNNTSLPKVTTDNPDIQNLHWHLNRLNGSNVFKPYNERERRLPLFLPMELIVLDFPANNTALLN
ncbi:MAG: hypothetical protein AABX07_04860 [Nanoarchaeota archaeon]